mgnify:CR=1 FL=1
MISTVLSPLRRDAGRESAGCAGQKIRLQALFDKKDYAGVIASAEEAAAVQTDEEERSDVYFILGAAYNARTMPQQAIDAFRK